MRETKEGIRGAVSLTDLISEYTSVKRSRAKCPFHSDKNPSLSISDLKRLWHCFGCGVGGDCFSFLMLAEGINFPEALQVLAQRVGVSLPELSYDNHTQIESVISQRRQLLQSLEERKQERVSSLKEFDEFLGRLWKKFNAGDWEEKEKILVLIESCFMEIESHYDAVTEWYEEEKRKIYANKNV